MGASFGAFYNGNFFGELRVRGSFTACFPFVVRRLQWGCGRVARDIFNE